MKVKTLSRGLVIAISLGLVLLGVTAYAASTLILAVGIIPHSELFDGPATVTVRTLTIKLGEELAWHYHPGYAFNVVKSGTLTAEDGCGGARRTAITFDSLRTLEIKWKHLYFNHEWESREPQGIL